MTSNDSQNQCLWLADILKRITDSFMEIYEPYFNASLQHGWLMYDPFAISYCFGILSKKIMSNGEVSISSGDFVRFYERVMRRYYISDENISAMKNNWRQHVWSRDRWLIFWDSIQAYKNGLYSASVSTSVPLIEGILTVRTQANPFNLGKAKKVANDIDPSGNLGVIAEKIFRDTRRLDFNVEEFISRHAIAHGVDVNFGTQKNALQMMSFLNALVAYDD